MRKIILDLAVSLDGFIEGPNGEVDWCGGSGDSQDFEKDFGVFLKGIDTIFYGRISYELWGNYLPDEKAPAGMRKVFETVHQKEKFVFSKTKTFPDENVTVVNADLDKNVREIKNRPGKNIWLYGGGGIITSFMENGLIDEYRLAVHPIILGQGKPLFANVKGGAYLKFNGAKPSNSGVVLLSYEALR